MTESHDPGPTGGDDAGTGASDIDPRFDPAASGMEQEGSDSPAEGAGRRTAKPAQQQFAEMAEATSAWAREKPLQALAVAACLGFLLGRVGR